MNYTPEQVKERGLSGNPRTEWLKRIRTVEPAKSSPWVDLLDGPPVIPADVAEAVQQISPNRQKVVCVDFDGVIHSFTSPWHPGCPPLDDPVPGAFDFLFDCLSANFRVIIFSCRCETQEGENGIRDWFFKNNFPVGRGALLEYACKKPIADIYIDDKAFEFRGIFPTLDFVNRFKPWNK